MENKNNKVENENKIKKVVLFLKEINNSMSYKEIENLYINKYKLNERSNKINLRVINRNLFLKDSKREEKEVSKDREILKSKLKKVNIDYNSLVNKIKLIKRSNKKLNIIDIKEVEFN